MLCIVGYSILFISICSKSSSLPATNVKIFTSGNEIITHECSTDKMDQVGVYMYRQGQSSEPRRVFYYYYKDTNLDFKTTADKFKFNVSGKFPKLIVTFLNVTADDAGLYWCEFNKEEKITVGKFTWLWIEEPREKYENETKECPKHENPSSHEKIILILCVAALLTLLCIVCFVCVIWTVKRYLGNRTYQPSNPVSDSVYEEMKRSNLDDQHKVQTFINPEYQPTKELR